MGGGRSGVGGGGGSEELEGVICKGEELDQVCACARMCVRVHLCMCVHVRARVCAFVYLHSVSYIGLSPVLFPPCLPSG